MYPSIFASLTFDVSSKQISSISALCTKAHMCPTKDTTKHIYFACKGIRDNTEKHCQWPKAQDGVAPILHPTEATKGSMHMSCAVDTRQQHRLSIARRVFRPARDHKDFHEGRHYCVSPCRAWMLCTQVNA